jgi:hypothetical protein
MDRLAWRTRDSALPQPRHFGSPPTPSFPLLKLAAFSARRSGRLGAAHRRTVALKQPADFLAIGARARFPSRKRKPQL